MKKLPSLSTCGAESHQPPRSLLKEFDYSRSHACDLVESELDDMNPTPYKHLLDRS